MRLKVDVLIVILFSVMMLVFSMTIINVVAVSIFQYHPMSQVDLEPYVSSSNLIEETLVSKRGYIYDKNGSIIAQDVKTYNIICYLDDSRVTGKGEPAYVVDPVFAAQQLAPILNDDFENIVTFLSADNLYQTELGNSGRNLSQEIKEEIEAIIDPSTGKKLSGIEFVESVKRSYPMGEFASYLIGFAQTDETGHTIGKMGVEDHLNDELMGVDGERTYQAGKNNVILPGMRYEETPAINGNDVYLTLDQEIQEALETSFEITKTQFDADRIWGSVMEVDSGKILAWGQTPTFDPNELIIEDYSNSGSELPYEPGSTMKVFTYAAAIDSGVYPEETLVDSTTFCYGSSGKTPIRVACNSSNKLGEINNANNRNWGMISYDDGFVYSSNVATSSLLTNYLEDSVFEEYLYDFGFFNEVESDYISEINGIIKYTWPVEKLALTYGQGSTVTMLQLLQAFSAVFSDGTMVKPYYVDEIRSSYDNQEVLFKSQTEVVSNPITSTTAKKVQELMYDTANLDYGTARYYRIDETSIIAKTGTSQVAVDGSYDSGKTISSIVIGLPAEDPQYLVYYAFEADYDKDSHVQTEAVKLLLQKVAQTYNLSQATNTTTQEVVTVKEEIMPTLINQSLDYSLRKLEEIGVEVHVLGNQDTVINQHPLGDTTVVTNEKVFLLTDKSTVLMPNMIGWTRSEVTDFWKITGFPVIINGQGIVTSQSLTQGSQMDVTMELTVFLE